MAVVKGVKEKVHLPLYDSVEVKAGAQLRGTLTSNVMRFFVDVTGKTKLLTNMQAASLLPHWNTFEARALRIVISDLPPQFPETTPIKLTLGVVDSGGLPVRVSDTNESQKTVAVDLKLTNFVDFKRVVDVPNGIVLRLSRADLATLGLSLTDADDTILGSDRVEIGRKDLQAAAKQFGNPVVPINEQIFRNDGFGNVIGKFIYNTVATFFVGEKIMIQVPTWFFPAGAGPYSEDGNVVTHGYPNPQATFRFAEPVMIDTQQNFRVEIEVPESEVLGELQRLYGPLFIWVVLDGYMTRDVQ